MANSNPERQDTRDMLLVLIGVAISISFQSLTEGLDALIYPQGAVQYLLVESKFLLFGGFLATTFILMKALRDLRRHPPNVDRRRNAGNPPEA